MPGALTSPANGISVTGRAAVSSNRTATPAPSRRASTRTSSNRAQRVKVKNAFRGRRASANGCPEAHDDELREGGLARLPAVERQPNRRHRQTDEVGDVSARGRRRGQGDQGGGNSGEPHPPSAFGRGGASE